MTRVKKLCNSGMRDVQRLWSPVIRVRIMQCGDFYLCRCQEIDVIMDSCQKRGTQKQTVIIVLMAEFRFMFFLLIFNLGWSLRVSTSSDNDLPKICTKLLPDYMVMSQSTHVYMGYRASLSWQNVLQQLHKLQNTVWCHYYIFKFLQNIHKRYPIAHALGWGMGCLSWVENLIEILPQLHQWIGLDHTNYSDLFTGLWQKTKVIWSSYCSIITFPTAWKR